MDHAKSPRRIASKTRPRLALGGLAAAAGMSLTGCDVGPDFSQAQFTSIGECTTSGFSREACDAAYNAALREYAQSAPKFRSKEACEQEWGTGRCAAPLLTQEAGGGAVQQGGSAFGNVFVPALAGFALSQALQRRDYDSGYIGGGFASYGGTPIYRNRTGGTVTVDRSGGKAVTTPVNVNTRTVSSRGFGGMGMSRGGGFGG